VLAYDTDPNRRDAKINTSGGYAGVNMLADVPVNSTYTHIGHENALKIDKENGLFGKVLDALDRGGTYTEATTFAARNLKLLEFSGEKAFSIVSNIVGVAVIGDDLYKSYKAAKAGNYGQAGWQATKAIGTGVFMYFGGAEYQGAKLLWNLGTLLIDDSSEH
jgi:hypothetical protein